MKKITQAMLILIFLVSILSGCSSGGAGDSSSGNQVSSPSFSFNGGTYDSDILITITCSTTDATIYYTDNGTTPSPLSIEYNSGDTISISGNGTNRTLKAIAVKLGMADSQIITTEYHIRYNQVSTPELSISGGEYVGEQSLILSCTTPDAEIRYTLDSTDPTTTSGILYSSSDSVIIGNSTTIKVCAFKDGMDSSEIVSAKFDITYNWTNKIGGSSIGDISYDSNGNLYMRGLYEGTVNFASLWGGSNEITSNGNIDIFITKINSDGSYGWTISIGGSGNDYGNGLCLDSENNIYITGAFQGTVNFAEYCSGTENKTATAYDCFILKINSDSSFGWVKQIGGTQTDQGKVVRCDASGNLYIGGLYQGTVNFLADWGSSRNYTASNSDIFIMKIDSNGDYDWLGTYGAAESDNIKDIKVDNLGFLYIGGVYNISSTGRQSFIQKRNAVSGSTVWTKNIAHSGTGTSGPSITIDSSGNLYYAGQFYETVDFHDAWGTGSDEKSSSDDSADIFITKIDSEENYQWTKIIGGSSAENINDLTTDNDGNIFLSGLFNDTINFASDWTGIYESKTAITTGSSPFITRINNDGSYGGTKIIYGSASIYSLLSYSDRIYFGGYFNQGTINFAQDWDGTDNISQTPLVGSEAFLSKISNNFYFDE